MWLYYVKRGKDYLKVQYKTLSPHDFLLVQQIIYYKYFKPCSLSHKLKLFLFSVMEKTHKWRKKPKDGRDISSYEVLLADLVSYK